MQKLLLSLFIFQSLLLISCDTRVKKYDSIQVDFDKAKSMFPDSLVDQFPVSLTKPLEFYQQFESDDLNHALVLEQQHTAKEIDAIEKHLNRHAIASYKASDSCLFVVNRFARDTDWGLNSSYVSSMERAPDCSEAYLPVPNFFSGNNATLETPSRLPKDFTIYVLDAKKTSLGGESAGRWKSYLPDGWRDGFSKGVAVDKKNSEIIYWTIMW